MQSLNRGAEGPHLWHLHVHGQALPGPVRAPVAAMGPLLRGAAAGCPPHELDGLDQAAAQPSPQLWARSDAGEPQQRPRLHFCRHLLLGELESIDCK